MRRKRNLKRFMACFLVVSFWLYGVHLWYSRAQIVFSSDSQAFWEDVFLPEGVDMAEPIAVTVGGTVKKETDHYSQALLRAAEDSNFSCTTIVCNISALDTLCKERKNWLYQYLACNPGWRFYKRYGQQFAERRVFKEGQWCDENWEVQIDPTPKDIECDEFDGEFDSVESQCRICFGSFEFNWSKCKSGGQVNLPIKRDEDDFNDIEVVCNGEGLSVDVIEVSTFATSRVIQTAFNLTQKEFLNVQKATNWQQMKECFPEGAVLKGLMSLNLFYDLTFRGEILNYFYRAWINPGEPGETYLKVFEVSQGAELGVGADGFPAYIKDATLEFSGWSDNPQEKFLIGSKLALNQKKKDYAARVEIWFIPASGGPERKLIERVFKLKGRVQ